MFEAPLQHSLSQHSLSQHSLSQHSLSLRNSSRSRPTLLAAGLALGLLAAGGCRTPEPEPTRATDPRKAEDQTLGLPVHAGSVLEGLPQPELGLDGEGRG
jgi:hypothetical protein